MTTVTHMLLDHIENLKTEIQDLNKELDDWKLGANAEAHAGDEARATATEARHMLRKACKVIESLVDQQAMPDDFYNESLTKFKTYLESN